MEIGPILGVPAVTMVKPDRLSPDLSRVFEAEYLGGSPDDSYEASDPNAQDGEDEAAEESAPPAKPADSVPPVRKVDFFA
jgi:hypothetical protein